MPRKINAVKVAQVIGALLVTFMVAAQAFFEAQFQSELMGLVGLMFFGSQTLPVVKVAYQDNRSKKGASKPKVNQ